MSFSLWLYNISPMLPFPEKALILAPMVGLTNRAFRTLVAELGAPDYAFTEMASAEAFVAHAQYEAVYTDPQPSPRACSVQFYARSAAALAAACAEILKRDETLRPAGIDINFGCAAPHIRRSGGGAAWSSDPAGAAEMVAAARAAWPGTLSAKLRMGSDEDYDRLLFFCQSIAGAGLDFLSFHPRRDTQKFRHKARHDLSARLARDLSIPLVANGDIEDAGDVRALLDEGGAYAVMIGREAARRPWIFRRLRDELRGRPRAAPLSAAALKAPAPAAGAAPVSLPSPVPRAAPALRAAAPALSVAPAPGAAPLLHVAPEPGREPLPEALDRLTVGLRFLDLVETMLPEAWRLETSRRFFSYFCEPLFFAHHIKFRLLNSPSPAAMREALAEYFGQVPGDREIENW